MLVAIIQAIIPIIIQSKKSFPNHFIHFPHETPAIAKPAIREALVGVNRLVIPSPIWKANTAVCLVIPITSAMGIIIGIVTTAWPEPEGIKIFIIDYTINIDGAFIRLGSPFSK